jgi:alkanesulfonate monooxygenase SsuD/methylene tetrahydromethanopterin reductase-like flavin-dependent oxidoreductase (luciferase family)
MDQAPPMRFGLQLWSQTTGWAGFRDAARAADAAGWDSVWTWDHLLAIFGPWEQPVFEGWTVMSAVGAVTSRVRLGLMVGANTFRNPGLTAKMATTLDHVSDGRAILGLGAAWFDREHEAYGIEFGASPGERLDWLDESVMLLRRLLDGEQFDHSGPTYTFRDALCRPRPVQDRLPILIGGSGRRKTLRTVAERADAWNTSGTVAEVTDALEALAGHATAVGRDLATLEKTISFPIVVGDTKAAAQARMDALFAHNGVKNMGDGPHLTGSPDEIADALRPYRDLGFRTVIVRMPAPYDHETIERIGEVAERLAG